KNHTDVAVVTGPAQYGTIIEELRQHKGGLSLATRQRLALEAFEHTATYDAAIAAYLGRQAAGEAASLPPLLGPSFRRQTAIRYGENQHQQEDFYVDPRCRYACVATARQLHGKELSYNNLLDLDSALNLVREFTEPACAVIKHNNPCGAAVAETLEGAFQ